MDSGTKGKKSSPEAAFLGLPKKITKLLETESDRGAILILATYLDELLGLLITNSCVSDELGKDLLELRKPAGDFDSRIRVCQAFGIIHDEDVRALRVIQKIRNSAAHFDRKGRGFDVLFDSAATKAQVRALGEFVGLDLKGTDDKAVRKDFVVSCRFLTMRLLLRNLLLRRATAPKSAKDLALEAWSRADGKGLGKKLKETIERGQPGEIVDAVKPMLAAVTSVLGEVVGPDSILSRVADSETDCDPKDLDSAGRQMKAVYALMGEFRAQLELSELDPPED